MKIRAILAAVLFSGALLAPPAALAETLDCKLSSSAKWGSGSCDLKPSVTLREGMCVRVRVGGTASQVILRATRSGESMAKENTFLGETVTLGDDRVVVAEVPKTLDKVRTISVHGGKRAWRVEFRHGNGPATAESVEYAACEEFAR